MFHTERDGALFFSELLLVMTGLVLIVYAVGLVFALFGKAFRSPRALYMSFVLTTVASIPLVTAMIQLWPYLPHEVQYGDSQFFILPAFHAALLTFAWTAPIFQYCLSPTTTPEATRQMPDQLPGSMEGPRAR